LSSIYLKHFGDWILPVFRWNLLSWAQSIELVSISRPEVSYGIQKILELCFSKRQFFDAAIRMDERHQFEANYQILWQNHGLQYSLEKHRSTICCKWETAESTVHSSSVKLPLSKNERMISRKQCHFHPGQSSMPHCQS
jgi:hypothetical protein